MVNDESRNVWHFAAISLFLVEILLAYVQNRSRVEEGYLRLFIRNRVATSSMCCLAVKISVGSWLIVKHLLLLSTRWYEQVIVVSLLLLHLYHSYNAFRLLLQHQKNHNTLMIVLFIVILEVFEILLGTVNLYAFASTFTCITMPQLLHKHTTGRHGEGRSQYHLFYFVLAVIMLWNGAIDFRQAMDMELCIGTLILLLANVITL